MKKEKRKKIKKSYSKVKKKHDLPKFEELHKEFQLIDVEEEFILKEVVKKIGKRVKVFINNILPPIRPRASSLHSITESNIFSEEEKASIYKLYKRLNYIYHRAALTLLKEDKEKAKFIKETWENWGDLKEEMSWFMEKVVDGWKTEAKEKERLDYHG